MTVATFDTYAAAKMLREAGFNEGQAEAAVAMVRDAVTEGVATKADLQAVVTDLKADLRTAVAELKADLLKAVVGIVVAVLLANVGLTFAVVRLLGGGGGQ